MSKKRTAAEMAAEEGEKKQKVNATTAVTTSAATSAAAASSSLFSTAATALTPATYSAAAIRHEATFKSYTQQQATAAHDVLHLILPRKVLELDSMIANMQTKFIPNIIPPYNIDGTFITGRENELITSNPSVMLLIPNIRNEIRTFIDHLGTLKLMIQLRIPAVDDGSNYGVEIQEEAINELAKCEDVQFGYLEKLQSYYVSRTRLIAKISKYPSILDYWQSVNELDEAFHTDLRLHTIEMRNAYATIHDLLLKNETMIKNPRGEENESTSRANRRHAFA